MTTYKPTSGFFDISKCPKGLDKRKHEKMQEIQMYLAHLQSKSAYYREYHRIQWEKGKEISADLQQMIFQHYSHDELFGLAKEKQIEMAI
jgi:hypothetical protein